MADPFAVAQGAIRAAFGIPVSYTGAGLSAAPLRAIKADVAAPDFQGAGQTLRRISFEVAASDLPLRPGAGNVIVERPGEPGERRWRVIDAEFDSATCAWTVNAEAAQ